MLKAPKAIDLMEENVNNSEDEETTEEIRKKKRKIKNEKELEKM